MPRYVLAMLLALEAVAAAGGRVEHEGVSHVPWQDRRPLCPVDGEAFTIRFQTWRDDITAARVRVTTTDSVWVDAVRDGVRGLYDIWVARIPATRARVLRYWIELADGADIAYYSAGGISAKPPADGGFVLDFDTLAHAPLGATPTARGVVFKVWAPAATRATVPGTFNGWDADATPMRKVGDDFIAHVPGATVGQQYKFHFDGAVWNSDPRGRRIDTGEHDNASVEDPLAYRWHDADFRTPALADMVIYQLHVGTFAGGPASMSAKTGHAGVSARYADVAARVDHLRALGVNTVLLNPITEFSGPVNGGYDVITQWAPSAKYGTPGELAHLVDVLHQNGIAVLFDLVWNHTSPTGNFLWMYDGAQAYFDEPAVQTPWGAQADFDAPAVQDYYLDSALMWLEEFHVDGFRMDATAHMHRIPHRTAGWALMQRFNEWIDRRWADKVTIAEQIPSDPRITRSRRMGGAGFDAQYRRAFCDVLRQAVLDAASGDPSMDSVRRIIEGEDLAGHLGLSYFQLHDEAWPANGGKRAVVLVDPTHPHDDAYARGRTTLAQGIVMLAPGVPAMLMGDEWLEDTDFGPAHRIDWSKRERYAGTFAYYRDLIALRRSRRALRADAPVQVFHVDEQRNVIAFRRPGAAGADSVAGPAAGPKAGEDIVVIANFGNDDLPRYRVGLPARGPWREVLSNQSPAYGGAGPMNTGIIRTEDAQASGFAHSAVLAVPRMGLLVLAPAERGDAGEMPATLSWLHCAPGAALHVMGVCMLAPWLPRLVHWLWAGDMP